MTRAWLARATAGCALLSALACDPGGIPEDGASTVDAAPARDALATPDLATPDLATPDLATRDFATPDLATPDFATPDLATPDFATPDLATPDLATPDLATPDLAMPDLVTPGFPTGHACTVGGDCMSGVCNGKICRSPVGTVSFGAMVTAGAFIPSNGGYAVFGDLNRDGRVDVVTNTFSNGASSEVYVTLATGGGHFANPVAIPVGTYGNGPALGDVNGDGKLDLVVQYIPGQTLTIQVFLGNGDGTFTAGPSNTSLGIDGNASNDPPGLGDLDGDGRADIVYDARQGGVGYAFGQSDGSFSGGATGDPSGGRTTYITALPGIPGRLAVVDLSGNAYLTTVGLLSQQPALSWSNVGVVRIYADDFDLDGHWDPVIAGTVWLGGMTAASSPIGAVAASGDVNRDGFPDVVVDGSFTLNLGNGDGTTRSAVAATFTGLTDPAAVADVDGDGLADVLSFDYGCGCIRTFLNTSQ